MRTARFYVWIAVSLLTILILTFGATARGASLAPGKDDSDSSQQMKEQETIRKSFTLPAGERLLDVDDIIGTIEVTGSQTDQIQVVVNKTIRAESKEKLEKARQEVSLEMTQEGGTLKLFVKDPSRCNHSCCDSCAHRGYSVRMDFQLQVPQNITVKLCTVNGGHIQVKNVTGAYSVHNVNGGIEMEDVAGSGMAKTVNGNVKAIFRENPRQNSDFSSINGNIELYFTPNLSADFRFKTLNGGIFTDFPVTSVPARASQVENHNGKFKFRADRFTGGRIGAGGPEIKAESVNGNIRILERQ